MNKLAYEVLGVNKRDILIGTYREALKHLDEEITIEKINDAMSNLVHKTFSGEVKRYCDRNYRIEEWVVGEIVSDLQTYHYL